MGRMPRRSALSAAIVVAIMAPSASHAVRLDADGLGQALIFPYYTARSVDGNPLNTYISVVNHRTDEKALRVRFREGRTGAEVASFNLFLAPNDMWTGAVVPFGDGARLLTTDRSCTDPAFTPGTGAGAPSSIDFLNFAYSGVRDDGAGSGLERTREGYVEMIEMATLTGTAAAAVTQDASGVPANCAAVQGAIPLPVTAPTGGLSGGLTLINVANGMDFTTNAEALADLSSRAFYHAGSDGYPDFNVPEIDPVSVVVNDGALYRSVWARGVDAVTAVLMKSSWASEFVLDAATASNTDIVATFPTRRFYVTRTSAAPPFSRPSTWAPTCTDAFDGEDISFNWFTRTGFRSLLANPDSAGPIPKGFCAACVVFDLSSEANHSTPPPATRVLGSLTRGFGQGTLSVHVENGWLLMGPGAQAPVTALVSLPQSSRLDLATGTAVAGAHAFAGMPLVGFSVRTFVNGTLTCGAGACQGNYGGAFPFRFTRLITAGS